jgi:hypothetical protein
VPCANAEVEAAIAMLVKTPIMSLRSMVFPPTLLDALSCCMDRGDFQDDAKKKLAKA